MNSFLHFIYEMGSFSLHIFWLPVALWTIIAGITAVILNIFEDKIAPVFHYHGRVALLWSLALGCTGSLLFYFLPFHLQAGTQISSKLILIHTPLPAGSSAAVSSLSWTSPALWLGIATCLVLLLTVIGLTKLMLNFISLRRFTGKLPFTDAAQLSLLSPENMRLMRKAKKGIKLTFTREVDVPCTFGWFHKKIVLPLSFFQNNDKVNIALRHELMHISNGDYLINASMAFIRALFQFHPLVHRLSHCMDEYREIYCDQHVLSANHISRKSYANLLLELSHKPVFKPTTAVNMAVSPSTLKKRIQAMNTSTSNTPSPAWSISLILIFTFMITGLMACSDINDDGITRADVQKKQSSIYKIPGDKAPLYIVNDKQVKAEKLKRLKPKYIKSINVLKGQKATKEYGQKGKNGVVNIKLNVDIETALNDLRDSTASTLAQSTGNQKTIYIKSHQMPTLIGGQQALSRHLTYPKRCKDAGVEGKVMVQFVVNKQGQVENPTILQGIGHGCDQAAINAVKQARFKPGRQDGKAVNVQFNWPINFKLADDSSSKQE